MMSLLCTHQGIKSIVLGSLLGFLSINTFAKQLLSEETLAQTVGEKSPIQLNTQSKGDDNTDIETLLSDQNLALMESQVLNEKRQQYYQPMRVSIQMNEDSLYNKEQLQARKIHENAENNFGLEPFSMTWNGNFQAIVDLDRINNMSFSQETGQYELNNVQGRVTIVVETY